LLAVTFAVAPGTALADGDPASDVLASQTAYVPADAAGSLRDQGLLGALTRAAAAAGEPVRVAVIGAPYDLGSISALWRHPQLYADYLGQELAAVFRGDVLVVMPDGLGLYRAAGVSLRERVAVSRGGPPAGGGLLGAALAGVRRLTSAGGHPLPARILAGPLRGGPARSPAPVPWLVFGAGWLAVLGAWAASVRARPITWSHSRPSRTGPAT
jgi:hypothetical protein